MSTMSKLAQVTRYNAGIERKETLVYIHVHLKVNEGGQEMGTDTRCNTTKQHKAMSACSVVASRTHVQSL